jgi:Na+/melibiose symporter-like transporter
MARRRALRTLAAAAIADLFDQETAFGRLALVQVLMLAGDTLVTISLAGSLFFSISPDAAEGKVLLYLLLTVAPFAIVSPLLGPAIDVNRRARRLIVCGSAAGRVVLCFLMAANLHTLWLFPLAFFVLVLSKLYLVTRGALVPEMAAADQRAGKVAHVDEAGWPTGEVAALGPGGVPRGATSPGDVGEGFAGFNAQLTLLGTLAGFAVSLPGIGLLKAFNAETVLIFASLVFVAAAGCALRLRVPDEDDARDAGRDERDEHLDRVGFEDREVVLGLTASATVRLSAGFLTFLIAFGLRRGHAPLWWYGAAFAASGAGALLGLYLVRRLRRRLSEQWLLGASLALLVVASAVACYLGTIAAQVGLAFVAGVAGAITQPSFDALTQRRVPERAQGRVFARFAVRQQLAWVLGALIPVAIAMPFAVGDGILATLALVCFGGYAVGRLVAQRGGADPATASR